MGSSLWWHGEQISHQTVVITVCRVNADGKLRPVDGVACRGIFLFIFEKSETIPNTRATCVSHNSIVQLILENSRGFRLPPMGPSHNPSDKSLRSSDCILFALLSIQLDEYPFSVTGHNGARVIPIIWAANHSSTQGYIHCSSEV